MSGCNIHKDHDHEHGPGCGHVAIKHGDHIDYLHDELEIRYYSPIGMMAGMQFQSSQ